MFQGWAAMRYKASMPFNGSLYMLCVVHCIAVVAFYSPSYRHISIPGGQYLLYHWYPSSYSMLCVCWGLREHTFTRLIIHNKACGWCWRAYLFIQMPWKVNVKLLTKEAAVTCMKTGSMQTPLKVLVNIFFLLRPGHLIHFFGLLWKHYCSSPDNNHHLNASVPAWTYSPNSKIMR